MNHRQNGASNRLMLGPKSCFLAFAFVGVLGAVSVAHALSVGSRAPEIGLRDLSGRPVRLSEMRNKVVLVDFWASWCEPCKEEMPVLESLHRKYRNQGFVVVGVNVDRDVDNARRFLRRNPVTFRVVHDGEHTVSGRYRPTKMPSSYIIDKRGIVRHVHEGFRAEDAARIEREVRALLR